MIDERSGVHLGHLDLGSGFALWINEMTEDESSRFRGGVGVLDDDRLGD